MHRRYPLSIGLHVSLPMSEPFPPPYLGPFACFDSKVVNLQPVFARPLPWFRPSPRQVIATLTTSCVGKRTQQQLLWNWKSHNTENVAELGVVQNRSCCEIGGHTKQKLLWTWGSYTTYVAAEIGNHTKQKLR